MTRKDRIIESMKKLWRGALDPPDFELLYSIIESAKDDPEPTIDRWTLADGSEVEALPPEVGDLVEAWNAGHIHSVGTLAAIAREAGLYDFCPLGSTHEQGWYVTHVRRFVAPIKWALVYDICKSVAVWGSGRVAMIMTYVLGETDDRRDRVVAIVRRPSHD